jgi:hypothetical protein
MPQKKPRLKNADQEFQLWMRSSQLWMRSSHMVRASDCQCQSRNSPEAGVLVRKLSQLTPLS